MESSNKGVIRFSNQGCLRGLEYLDRLLARYRWVTIKEIVETIPCLQVLNQDTNRNSGSGEHSGSAEDTVIAAGRLASH